MKMGKEVFLSYGREPEVSAFVKRLKTDLEARGISVWLDTDDIPAGSDWHGAIGTGLQQSKALVAVVTTKYLNSKFCTNELYTASSDQKDIFPVILENIDFNASERARGVKYVIGSINWTLFGTGYDYGTALERLVQGMKRSGLGGGVSDTDDGPVTNLMDQLHLSPGTYPPPSAPPPEQAPPTSFPSPSHPTYYSPGRGGPHTPHYYPNPYSPPQGHTAGYGPSPPAGYPYHYPTHTPPHLTPSYPHYQHTYPNTTMATTHMRGGVTPPPPPYTPEATDRAEGEPSLSKTPLSANFSPSPSPSPATHRPLTQQGTPLPPPSTPSTPSFRVGMKLEATDRRFPYFVCVATIMDRRESEVLIHFDGWGPEYDYWCGAGSLELHPPGWCHTHNWELQTPLNQSWTSWDYYLSETDSPATPDSLFNEDQLAAPGSLLFKEGMKLEAKDRQNPTMVAVATITSIKDGRLLIHFDGWTTRYDYWCRPESTDIHPPHWCNNNHRKLYPPKPYSGPFKWSQYLRQPGPVPAPAFIFTQEQRAVPSEVRVDSHSPAELQPAVSHTKFKPGMRLEAKDRQYPTLVCVATVAAVTQGKLLVHFDGWTSSYDYQCESDSTDIHPVGWCKKRGHDLQKPQGYEGEFNWDQYLSQNGYEAAPANLFTPAQKN